MMREDYSEALVEELLLEIDAQQSHVDQEAEKRFYDALGERPGYIDVEAFHKAYDALIKDANMADIFDEDGVIAGKWLYGRIKECANAQAARALKRLWVAQYVDRLKTSKQIEAQKAAENEVEERHRKAIEERDQKRQAIIDAANAAKEKAMQALDPKLVAAYKLAAETDDIANDVYIEPQFGFRGIDDATAEEYHLGVNGAGYYWLRQKDLGNTQLLTDRITSLLKDKILAISADFARNMAVDTIQKLHINEIRRWQAGYLLIDGLVYKVAPHEQN